MKQAIQESQMRFITLVMFEERTIIRKAIVSIVGILSKYDSDKHFPVFGFGAKYGGIVRHFFQCGPTPEANGVAGMLDAYHAVFKSGLIMSGPTVFTKVIQTAAARAISAQVHFPSLRESHLFHESDIE